MNEVCKKAKGLSQAHNWVIQTASTREGAEKKQKCTQCKEVRKFEAPKKGTQWMGKGVKETPLDTIAGQPLKGTAIVLGKGLKGLAKLTVKGIKKAGGS